MATGIKKVEIGVDIYNDLGAFWNEVFLIDVVHYHVLPLVRSDTRHTYLDWIVPRGVAGPLPITSFIMAAMSRQLET